jgi:glycosyltransferase involved in cell wall biosynthesis
MKVIQICHHVPPKGMDFWGHIFDGWYARFGREIIRQSADHEVECWCPARIVKSVEICKGGITFRIFPSVEAEFHGTVSFFLLEELRRNARSEKILVHLHGERSALSYSIAKLHQITRDFPLIIKHHGAGGVCDQFFSVIEKRVFKTADLFYTNTLQKSEYFVRDLGLPSDKVKLQYVGVDLDCFKPMDRDHCREMLNLPTDKTLVLYIGPFSRLKGLGILVEACEELKHKYDLELVAVGGTPQDPLYPLVRRKVKYYSLRVPSDRIPLYCNAADIFAWFFQPSRNLFGGIGVSVQEAMACNLPIVSNTLVHRPEGIKIEEIGELPNASSDVCSCIEKVLNRSARWKCDLIARKHFDWGSITKDMLKDYSLAAERYRGTQRPTRKRTGR